MLVEIGYRIDSAFRRRGFGFECAARLIEAAERLQAVSAVRASIAPENEPSLRIAKRLGFRRIGEQMDEIDGLELVFERKTEATPGRAIRDDGVGSLLGASRTAASGPRYPFAPPTSCCSTWAGRPQLGQ